MEGLQKAYKIRVQDPIEGEERREMLLPDAARKEGRKMSSTWNMTDAKQNALQNNHDRFQAYV